MPLSRHSTKECRAAECSREVVHSRTRQFLNRRKQRKCMQHCSRRASVITLLQPTSAQRSTRQHKVGCEEGRDGRIGEGMRGFNRGGCEGVRDGKGEDERGRM